MLTSCGLLRSCLIYAPVLVGILAADPFTRNAAQAQPHPNVLKAALATLGEAFGDDGGAATLSDFPIGVFDSGTGGLTVLEQILR